MVVGERQGFYDHDYDNVPSVGIFISHLCPVVINVSYTYQEASLDNGNRARQRPQRAYITSFKKKNPYLTRFGSKAEEW